MNYWLMKSEPDVFSIEDLKAKQTDIWDGVRNYQARNFLKAMNIGDQVFFYHSNTNPPGIIGLMTVVETQIVDPTQFDAQNKYFDPKSTRDNPRWHTVKVKYAETFKTYLALDDLKAAFTPDELWVVRKGNRLSVIPVVPETAERIFKLAR
jgi:predicted RNA-binding protein with PUA-like domain